MSKENTIQCRVVHLDVEDCSVELLRQQFYAMKNHLLWGLVLAGSSWHKGAFNRSFPCVEANYPYDIRNQQGASQKTRWMPELVFYGMILLAKEHCEALDQ